jgi:hypothetical protein
MFLGLDARKPVWTKSYAREELGSESWGNDGEADDFISSWLADLRPFVVL